MKLYAPTQILRVTLDQNLRPVLEAQDEALLPQHAFRDVFFAVPTGPRVFLTTASPTDVGPDFIYKLPPFPPGATFPIKLLPNQRLFGACESSNVQFALTVHYVVDGAL